MGLADIDRELASSGKAGGTTGLAAIDAELATPPVDTRSTATRLYQDYVAKPLTTAAEYAARPLMNSTADALVPLARVVNEGSLKPLVEQAPQTSAFAPNSAAKTAAELIVPQTPLQAGIAAGTLGAGPAIGAAGRAVPAAARGLGALQAVPGLGRLLGPAAGRIVGGTVGGAVGGAAENPSLEGAERGAATGAIATGAGEALGKLAPMVGTGARRGYQAARQATGGFAREQAARDAAAVGLAVGEIAPSLAGSSTAAELNTLASGAGREALSAQQQATVNKLSANGLLDVPSLVRAAGKKPGDMLTVQEAKDALATLRKATARNPMLQPRYDAANAELKSALEAAGGPGAVKDWTTMQGDYRRGLAALDKVLGRPGTYRPVEGGIELNMPALQAALQNPSNVRLLKSRLGEDGFAKLEAAVFRGAGSAAGRDVLGKAAALPGELRWAGRLGGYAGGGVGGAAGAEGGEWLLNKALGKILPNTGARYVGIPKPTTKPLDSHLQALIDLIAQRGATQ